MKQAAAFAELRKDLGLALNARIIQNGQPLALVDRASLVDALIAVAGFLHRVERLTRYSFQFNELASVLSDLDRGAMHPILTPKRNRSGSPPDPTDVLCAQGRVAFAIEMLVRANLHPKRRTRSEEKILRRASIGRGRKASTKKEGTPRERETKQVAKQVANQFSSLRKFVSKRSRSTTLANSIKNWHDKFSFDQIDNPEAREMYRSLLGALKSIEKSKSFSPAKLRKFAASHLRQTSKIRLMTRDDAFSSKDW
jgi:hypothetical protein